jgi:hypothetical protein
MPTCRRCARRAAASTRSRAAALAERIDIDAFVDFMALEAMLAPLGRLQPQRTTSACGCRRAVARRSCRTAWTSCWDADYAVLDHPPAIVASAVMQQPAFRKRYRERLKALLPLFAPARLGPRLQAVAEQAPEGTAHHRRRTGARAHADAVREPARPPRRALPQPAGPR